MRNLAFYRYSEELEKLRTDEEKISWFDGRVNQVLIKPIDELRHIWKANKNIQCLNLGIMTLLCSGIEALGNFYLQTGESGKKFRKFVEHYMTLEFREKDLSGKKYSTHLWDHFRCGLAHGFTIERGGILEDTDRYIRFDDTRGLGIDLWYFFDDFKRAFKKYISELRSSKENSFIRKNFLSKFNELFGRCRCQT